MVAFWHSLRKNRHFHFRVALLALFLVVLGNHPTAYTDADRVKESPVTLSPASVTAMPTTSAAQQLEEAVNAVRGEMHLPALTLDPRLCAAADGHAAYLTRNHIFSHEENATLPGFVAVTAAERAKAQGYSGNCYETVSAGIPDESAVRRLFDAPYHRAPFLQPGTFDFGSATQSDVVTLEFGVTPASGVVTYPYDGEQNVPTTWDGIETPNPMRLHDDALSDETGYVITLFRYRAGGGARLKVASANLTTLNGKPVPTYLNTPDNDSFLHNGALLIPREALQSGMTYRVAVQATDSDGVDCSRTWTFTTMSASLAAPPAETIRPLAAAKGVLSRVAARH